MFRRCLENRVIKEQWGYTCLLCKYVSFDHNFEIIDMHINSPEHELMMKEKSKIYIEWQSKFLNNMSESDGEKLVENHIAFFWNSTKPVKCGICPNKSIYSLKDANSHITGKKHNYAKNNLNVIGNGISRSVDNQKFNDPACDLTTLMVNNEVKAASKNCYVSKELCKMCNEYFEDDITLNCHVMVHIFLELKFSKSIDLIQCNTANDGSPIMKCLLCQIVVSSCTDLKEHVQSYNHLNSMEYFSIDQYTLPPDLGKDIRIDVQSRKYLKNFLNKFMQGVIHCQLCNMTFKDTHLHNHECRNKHKYNLKKNSTKYNFKNKIKKLSKNYMHCFICTIWYDSFDKLIYHYNSKAHKSRMYCLHTIINSPFLNFTPERLVSCSLCQIKSGNCKETLEHIFGRRHRMNLELQEYSDKDNGIIKNNVIATDNQVKILIPVKNSLNVLSNGTSQPKSLPSEANDSEGELNDLLNKLVKFDSAKANKNKKLAAFIQNPSKSSDTNKKSNLFCANVLKWGGTYIKYCIEPGPLNIYNLDPDQVRLLKLGVSLMFPTINSEQMCLPCGSSIPNDKNYIYEHLQDSNHIGNIKALEAHDKEFIDYPDQFSDLGLAKQFMVELNEDRVQCYACNVALKNDNIDISLHAETSKHVMIAQTWCESSKNLACEFSYIFQNVWYYAQVFNCEICNFKCDFEIEFIIHLKKKTHVEIGNMYLARGTITKFDFCPACVTYWFGKMDSHRLHCEASYHRRFANNGDFAIPKMSAMTIDLLEKVDTKIVNLELESDKAKAEKNEEFELLKAIEETVSPAYPDAKAYTFGSRLSNLGFPDSDVDVFLDCHGAYTKISNQEEDQKIVMDVKNFFEEAEDAWIIDEILLGTRVPILKLRHIPTSLKCDISFTNGLSVEKSTLVGLYNNAYRNCRLLILYLKKWLTSCKLAGSECITTFATTWLVIFYLQTEGILRSVYDLISLKNESKIIDGWECGFTDNTDTYILPTAASESLDFNFKDHLRGFFAFYAHFDFRSYVICPYVGKALRKKNFAFPESLSSEYNLYKNRLREDVKFVFRYDSPMCIQDPVDLSQNMTKAVKKLQLRCFKQYCIESYHIITNI